MNFDNVQSAIWTSDQQENVKVTFNDGNKFTLQKGSNQWTSLIDAGWTEEKIIQSTAEYKRSNAGQFFQHIDRLARESVGYEYQVQKLRDELDDFFQDNDVYREEYFRRFFQDIDDYYEQNNSLKAEYARNMFNEMDEIYDQMNEVYEKHHQVDKDYHDMLYKNMEEKRELERTILYNFSTEKILTEEAVKKAKATFDKNKKAIEAVSLKNDESLLSNIIMFLNKYNNDEEMISKLRDMAAYSGKDKNFSEMKSVMEILTALNE